MGVTLACEYTKRSMDLGYIGFNRLRNKIAELAGEPFLSHYAKLDNLSFGTEKDFQAFDLVTARIVLDRRGFAACHRILYAIRLRRLRHMESVPEAAENHRRLRR